MSNKFVYFFTLIYFNIKNTIIDSASIRHQHKAACNQIPMIVLEEVLGAAFNSRYMSIEEPSIREMPININNNKRTANSMGDFYVDSNFNAEIDNIPAWDVINHVSVEPQQQQHSARRLKRDVDYSQEWHCKSKIVWIDLGADYFPRYLRTVECQSKNCWFNIYRCQPRSFTVKILRRKQGVCVAVEKGARIVLEGLPSELRELWVWEERAVSFCCDCVLQ